MRVCVRARAGKGDGNGPPSNSPGIPRSPQGRSDFPPLSFCSWIDAPATEEPIGRAAGVRTLKLAAVSSRNRRFSQDGIHEAAGGTSEDEQRSRLSEETEDTFVAVGNLSIISLSQLIFDEHQ